MKKFVAMLLALCMVFCLCACGSGEKEADVQTGTLSGFTWENAFLGILVSCTIQGVPYYCTQMCIKQGKYIGSVSLCSFSEDLSDFLIGYFYGLDA